MKTRLAQQQRGVALITALLVVALATLAAVALTSRQSMDVRRTSNVLESEQAYLYSLGIETVAKALLKKYTEEGEKYDDPAFLQTPYSFPVENGMVNGYLVDMEARFNINNLLNAEGKPDEIQRLRFERLIRQVSDNLGGSVEPESLSAAVLDWLDADQETRFPGGAEDGEYSGEGYRVANRLMANISELYLIKGFTPELLEGRPANDEEEEERVAGLLEFVAALPDSGTTININTASEELLTILSSRLDKGNIGGMLSERPFKEVSAFRDKVIKELMTDDKEKDKEIKAELETDLTGLDVQSSYYTVAAETTVGRSVNLLNSLIYRDTAARKPNLTIRRAQGLDKIMALSKPAPLTIPPALSQ